MEAGPGILQDCSSGPCGEVEAQGARSQDLQLGQDPKALRVPLEAIRQSEPFPRQSIKNPLAHVAEGRMAKIMSRGCRLYHNMIKTSKILQQILILRAKQSYRDRASTTPLVAIEVTTCVTSASRERALANRIRSRSVRNSDSPGGYGRSGSGRDLASRGSMSRTLPNPAACTQQRRRSLR